MQYYIPFPAHLQVHFYKYSRPINTLEIFREYYNNVKHSQVYLLRSLYYSGIWAIQNQHTLCCCVCFAFPWYGTLLCTWKSFESLNDSERKVLAVSDSKAYPKTKSKPKSKPIPSQFRIPGQLFSKPRSNSNSKPQANFQASSSANPQAKLQSHLLSSQNRNQSQIRKIWIVVYLSQLLIQPIVIVKVTAYMPKFIYFVIFRNTFKQGTGLLQSLYICIPDIAAKQWNKACLQVLCLFCGCMHEYLPVFRVKTGEDWCIWKMRKHMQTARNRKSTEMWSNVKYFRYYKSMTTCEDKFGKCVMNLNRRKKSVKTKNEDVFLRNRLHNALYNGKKEEYLGFFRVGGAGGYSFEILRIALYINSYYKNEVISKKTCNIWW